MEGQMTNSLDDMIADVEDDVAFWLSPDGQDPKQLAIAEAILARLVSLRDAGKELPGEPECVTNWKPDSADEVAVLRHIDALRAHAEADRARVKELEAEREAMMTKLREPSEDVLDSVRGVLQILRGTPGADYAQVANHCRLRGDDMSLWPKWADALGGAYVTEQGAAKLLLDIMVAAIDKAMTAALKGE